MNLRRRTFLKVLGATSAAAAATHPLMRALADSPPGTSDEFFIFIHNAGGWDVTLWADPRNERKGLIEPASSDNITSDGVTQWVDQALDADTKTFQLVQPSGSNLIFGPAIGDLAALYSRLCVINGISMNTVSHPDGTYFSSTGRHLAGGRPVACSVDTMVANELGTGQLFPSISVQFPSTYVGSGLDQRAVPLRVGSVATVGRSLTRSNTYDTVDDRDAVTMMLTDEATDLAKQAYDPTIWTGEALQLGALRRMISSNLIDVFNTSKLQAAQPAFNYKGKYQSAACVSAAFAIEAMKQNIVRSVSFATSSCDTHNSNYKFHALILQETFNMIATLINQLDQSPHPTIPGDMLSQHTHIVVLSEFCRTPQINLAGGRDHYPNNSALIVSPRFQGNKLYGSSDPDQLLPADSGSFAGGPRPITPPDILTTLVSAFGIEPRKYLRDGEVVKEILA